MLHNMLIVYFKGKKRALAFTFVTFLFHSFLGLKCFVGLIVKNARLFYEVEIGFQ